MKHCAPCQSENNQYLFKKAGLRFEWFEISGRLKSDNFAKHIEVVKRKFETVIKLS